MDFDKLMKQAKVKQKVAEQKHVIQKQHKKESRKREVDQQKEERRKAAEKLKEMKETARRKQLEYKGLISSNKNSQSTSALLVPSTPAVSGHATSSNKDRVKDRGGGSAAPVSSISNFSKPNKKANKSINGTPITKGTSTGGSSSLSTGKSISNSKSKSKSSKVSSPSSSSSATSAKSNSKSSISHSVSTSAKPSKGMQASNFEDLLKTAKQNAFGEKGVSKLDKSASAGKPIDDAKLKEPIRRSSSPVGRSLVERSGSRLKNKRSHDVMKQGLNPRGSSGFVHPPPSSSSISGASSSNYPPGRSPAKCGQPRSRLVSPANSDDLVRRPLRSPVTNGPPPLQLPSKQNGMRSSLQLERTDMLCRQTGSQHSASNSSKAQSTSSTKRDVGGSNGVRGSKTPFPPLSSLTPQQVQKLKAARAAALQSSGGRGGSGLPPAKKSKTMNATAFYGSAAASLLQRRGQPKLSASGPMRYTSSYVDEMMDFMRLEGVNGVEDLYSDEEDDYLDDFIASDDEFIDDSEEGGDYSSVIGKIFGYDRSRYAGYDDNDDDDMAMESSYAQQEFEETRSARIGRQEDEEDIRREQQQLSKKKGKSSGKSSVNKLKQSKLTFR